ncbi:hypothetical protein [Acanthopleuribacter pedis]|uniref:Uncharacterized protein n=1 Tax=Acanthopleuribacter pedis TaxID=442870 RepID=A0A8J7Q762_9BACT|nr:hypothetical protein [Acanthopleuribacter pedis]MBO1319531.1 hypothetical protein [Acanthopleuribacter pedis]
MKYVIVILLCLSTAYAQDLPVFKEGEELRAADLMTLVSEIETLRSEVELLKEQIEVAKSSNPGGKIKVPPINERANSVGDTFVWMKSARYNSEKLIVDIIIRSKEDQKVTFLHPVLHDSNGNSWNVLRGNLYAGNTRNKYKNQIAHTLVKDIDTRIRYIFEQVKSRPNFVARIDIPFVIKGTSEKLILKDIPVEGS